MQDVYDLSKVDENCNRNLPKVSKMSVTDNSDLPKVRKMT